MPSTEHLDVASAYDEGELLPDPLPTDPFTLLHAWFRDAHDRAVQPNPNAMTLATVDPDGRPSARIVLCKALRPDPGVVVFYTNYESRKGRALAANPHAALIMHWDHLDRQVRIEGPVTVSPPEESDVYFNSRRWESRVGAWASQQSQPIESREKLLDQVAETIARLNLDMADIVDNEGRNLTIPRPPHWGGFRVWAQRVELWCGGVGRVHDRAQWTRTLTPTTDQFTPGPWSATRVQP